MKKYRAIFFFRDGVLVKSPLSLNDYQDCTDRSDESWANMVRLFHLKENRGVEQPYKYICAEVVM